MSRFLGSAVQGRAELTGVVAAPIRIHTHWLTYVFIKYQNANPVPREHNRKTHEHHMSCYTVNTENHHNSSIKKNQTLHLTRRPVRKKREQRATPQGRVHKATASLCYKFGNWRFGTRVTMHTNVNLPYWHGRSRAPESTKCDNPEESSSIRFCKKKIERKKCFIWYNVES